MTPLVHRKSRGVRAFSLTELLVVISIIGLLAGLSTLGITRAMEAGRKAKAKGDLMAIVSAVKAYKQEYGRWPCRTNDLSRNEFSSWYGPPTEEADGKILFRILSGENVAFTGENLPMNPKQIAFLEGAKRSTGRRDTSGGALVDPWGTQYSLKMDTDETGAVEYYNTSGSAENIRMSVIAISSGKNKQQDDPEKVRTPTCDDVFSWRD
jgi:prepilin-type N-terminal cleavage/methylation domain-containing protein